MHNIIHATLLCSAALGAIGVSAWLFYAGRGFAAMVLALVFMTSGGACLSSVVGNGAPVVVSFVLGVICLLGVALSLQYPYDSLRDQRRGVKGKFAIDPVAIAREVANKQNKK